MKYRKLVNWATLLVGVCLIIANRILNMWILGLVGDILVFSGLIMLHKNYIH